MISRPILVVGSVLSEQPLAPPAEDVITGLEFLVDLPMWSLVGHQNETKKNKNINFYPLTSRRTYGGNDTNSKWALEANLIPGPVFFCLMLLKILEKVMFSKTLDYILVKYIGSTSIRLRAMASGFQTGEDLDFLNTFPKYLHTVLHLPLRFCIPCLPMYRVLLPCLPFPNVTLSFIQLEMTTGQNERNTR